MKRYSFDRLKKNEIVWLMNHRCLHRKRYFEHISCARRELQNKFPILKERIGFLDIETDGLEAPYSNIYTYCIKERGGKIITNKVTFQELHSNTKDKRLVQDCVDDMRRFDRLVLYYGIDRKFDIPYLRTKAVHHNINFPKYKEILVTDLHPIIRNKFKFPRNTLRAACEYFGIPAKGTPINHKMAERIKVGNPYALNWYLRHNKEDVVSTELLFEKVNEFVHIVDTSI